MRSRFAYALAATATATALMACTLIVDGCGSIACTETDTCAADGSVPVDRTAPDVIESEVAPDVTNDVDATLTEAGDAPEPDAETAADSPTDAPADITIEVMDAPKDTAPDVPPDVPADRGVDAPPTCTGLGNLCVPPIPAGWTGPIALYDNGLQAGGPAPSPVPCSSADGAYTQPFPNSTSTQLGHYTPTAVQPTCGCSCGATVTGVTCPNPTVEVGTSSCPVGGTTATGTATPTCTQLTTQDINSIQVTLGTASGGSCATNETGLPVPTWSSTTGWEGTGNACFTGTTNYGTTGCTGGDICVPPPPTPFSNGAVCIYFPGQQSCPPGSGYTTPHDYFSGASDTRGCSYSCTCTPTGVACTSDVTVSNQASCTGGITLNNLPNGCTPSSGTPENIQPAFIQATVSSSGSCTFAAGAISGGAQATGGVTPNGQVTVCCN
jgi:hypothetical protein